LNLRPSGYEPDDLPGCSTPSQWVRLLSEPAFGHDVPGPVLCQLRRRTPSASVLDTTQLLDRGPFPTMLCPNRQVSGLLEQLPKLRLGSEAHGSICVQEGQPTKNRGFPGVLTIGNLREIGTNGDGRRTKVGTVGTPWNPNSAAALPRIRRLFRAATLTMRPHRSRHKSGPVARPYNLGRPELRIVAGNFRQPVRLGDLEFGDDELCSGTSEELLDQGGFLMSAQDRNVTRRAK
jgi:hypothetical protein